MSLAAAANSAIDAATNYGIDIPGTNETHLVARLVAKLPELLVQQWSGQLKTGVIYVSSAFCHHQPSVSWVSSLGFGAGTPELADLVLTVVSRDKTTNRMTERVLLIQAKTSDKSGAFSLSADTEHKQRHMFTFWDPFTFRGVSSTSDVIPRSKKDTKLNIKQKVDEGTRYAGVCLSSTPTCRLEAGPATWSVKNKLGSGAPKLFEECSTVNLQSTLSLGDALEQMYDKGLGREFIRGSDDWSTVIEYLFEYASKRKTLIQVTHAAGVTPTPLASASGFISRNALPFVSVNEWKRYKHYYPWFLREFPDTPKIRSANGHFWNNQHRDRDFSDFSAGFGVIRIYVDGDFDDGLVHA